MESTGAGRGRRILRVLSALREVFPRLGALPAGGSGAPFPKGAHRAIIAR